MKKCGIYFLKRKGVVIYIGQTTDLVHRMGYHNSQLMDYDCIRFIKCDKLRLIEYETRWIKRFKPVENVRHARPRKKYYYYQPVLRATAPKKHAPKLNERNMKFRKLTRKSIIGFGHLKDVTVDKAFRVGKAVDLIQAYYRLSHITFFDDVLNDLKITDEWRIAKPGTSVDRYREFIELVYPEEVERQHARQYTRSVGILKGLKHDAFNKMQLKMKNEQS